MSETQPEAVLVPEHNDKIVAGPPPAQTAAQAKVDAVAALTLAAYQRAATLELTPEETAKLQADFPDDAFQNGAAGKEQLIYIEHAHLRDRFNSVFGMGKWAIVPRNRWGEDFSFVNKYKETIEASRIYVEAMLIVRGCFVGEAVGDMVYYKNNDSQNYGDAVEGAKTAAFRRCAKEFGVGLQAWKKDWCLGWWQRRKSVKPPQNVQTTIQTPPANKNAPTGNVDTKKPVHKADVLPKEATETTRRWFLDQLVDYKSEDVVAYARDVSILLPVETLAEWPLQHVPTSKEALREWMGAFEKWRDGSVAPAPAADEPWRSFPMPFGKKAGVALGDLEKPYLYGLWANFEVEEEYNGKPKKPETIEKDTLFREMLNAAGEHYEFKEAQ